MFQSINLAHRSFNVENNCAPKNAFVLHFELIYFIVCLFFADLISKQTIKIESRVSKNRQKEETLIDLSILILNKMVDAINELASDADVNQIYESIAEFMRDNKEEPENRHLRILLGKLNEKITSFEGPNKMKIFANFTKFSLRMMREYKAQVECSTGSKLLTVNFYSKQGFDVYIKDLENGQIGDQILELILYPPFLERFGLKADDAEISLNGSLLTQHRGKKNVMQLVLLTCYVCHPIYRHSFLVHKNHIFFRCVALCLNL